MKEGSAFLIHSLGTKKAAKVNEKHDEILSDCPKSPKPILISNQLNVGE